MKRFALALSLVAAPAFAESGLFLSGPKGCTLIADWSPTDAGPGAFLKPDHWFLDYVVVESWDVACWVDGDGFTLEAEAGKVETLAGGCDMPDGEMKTGTFTLTYVDEQSAWLDFTAWDAPLDFKFCPIK